MSEQYPWQQANNAAAIGGGLHHKAQEDTAYRSAVAAKTQSLGAGSAPACEVSREADSVICQIAYTLQRIETQRNRLTGAAYRISGPYPCDPQKDQARDVPSDLCGKLRILLVAAEGIEAGMVPALDTIERVI